MKVEFHISTESKILALTPNSKQWVEYAFYYPSDKDYFYQLRNGKMIPIGKNASEYVNNSEGIGIGVKLNGQIIGGVKTHIEPNDLLEIPYLYDYNTFSLKVSGKINCSGITRIM